MTAAPRKRIVFVINSLGPGGAERVMDDVMRMAPPVPGCSQYVPVRLVPASVVAARVSDW